MGELSDDEIAVIMHMSGDLAYTAADISAELYLENPKGGWTPRKVMAVRRKLYEKGYACYGHLGSEDDTLLRGRGYWLSGIGCAIRYPKGNYILDSR